MRTLFFVLVNGQQTGSSERVSTVCKATQLVGDPGHGPDSHTPARPHHPPPHPVTPSLTVGWGCRAEQTFMSSLRQCSEASLLPPLRPPFTGPSPPKPHILCLQGPLPRDRPNPTSLIAISWLFSERRECLAPERASGPGGWLEYPRAGRRGILRK